MSDLLLLGAGLGARVPGVELAFHAPHTGAVLTEYDSTVLGSPGCTIGTASGRLEATINSSVDTEDFAYAEKEVWPAGQTGAVYIAIPLAEPAAQAALSGAITLLEAVGFDGVVIWSLLLSSTGKAIRLTSPAGGLRSTAIEATAASGVTDVFKRVEVKAHPSDSYEVRVDGTTELSLTGLTGGTTQGVRWLRNGIIRYAAGSSGKTFYSDYLKASSVDWIGA